MLPEDVGNAKLVGRLWRPEVAGPSVVIVRDGQLVDVTATAPTVADFLDGDAAAGFDALDGEALGSVERFLHEPDAMRSGAAEPCLLAPCDLQAIKACGVTFARSMIERVIDERTAGDPARADEIRARIGTLIGGSLANLKAGSAQAMEVKAALQREGLWSQYLEVGIGPDAEVFTKAQPMSAVGHGALVGVNPISAWNNPEPEIVLAVNAKGEIRGATLGNDVNLRDVEGRSALLLGKAKDNNASCAIGPFVRLFDDGFTLADVEAATLTMSVKGTDGYELTGRSNMAEISRKPAELVGHAAGASHQYPDGFVLFLGTMFAPTQDRDRPGGGFTHKVGDVVEIATPRLGTLRNTVTLSDQAPPWTFGTRALMRNLGRRGMLRGG
ncbi:fumarylacetoacetate hydrolase family protein [Aureimonas leprariae]|uniref:Fumarylacetoacetate hydrolase family protein n=1 Tax=Plantimonas leprariae TaxID=2615207 RepID=A0A7V7TXS7_9HYPH|nr:fumarylacetoacetate hydrolase family protein [Aureimonas leprariae]KAB0681415.1 fumarylacetoacetate hydrolase family protein [Aureimonas leprariae]